MTADAVVLAVDLGTGGPKTALVSLDGSVLASEHQRVEPRVAADGTGVQDPNTWWTAVVAGIRALAVAHPDEVARLIAVAVTGQWGSTVPVDEDGEPVPKSKRKRKRGFSSGERQIRSLEEITRHTSAQTYLLDEWDANLDATNRARADALVAELASRARVVEISHRDRAA